MSAAVAVRYTEVAAWVGFGDAETPDTVGLTLSTSRLVVAVGPQLPASSLEWTEIVCEPLLHAATVASGMSAWPPSAGLLKKPSLAVIGMPEPSVPTESMKTSPVLMGLLTLPEMGSDRVVADTRTAGVLQNPGRKREHASGAGSGDDDV